MRGARLVARGGAFLGAAAAAAAIGWGAARGAAAPAPTRADLEDARSRVAVLESELALARARKPYVVLDLEKRTLRYGLCGMRPREVRLVRVEARGLEARREADGAPARALAGIVTLQAKEGDPRLTPLSAEDVEAGAADENAADVLPPDPPAGYSLSFKEPVVVRVNEGALGGLAASIRAGVAALFGGGSGRRPPRIVIAADLGDIEAREVYRSLVPGQRIILVPPRGLVLPDVGQTESRAIRPARPVAPPPSPVVAGPEVPFRIPPPVDDAAPAPAGPESPGDEPGTDGAVPAEPAPAPGSEEGAPPPAGVAPSPGEEPSGGEDAGEPAAPPGTEEDPPAAAAGEEGPSGAARARPAPG